MKIISMAYVSDVCGIGRGHLTCRYLQLTGEGFTCGKTDTGLKRFYDAKAARGEIVAEGDNCVGWNPALVQIGGTRDSTEN